VLDLPAQATLSTLLEELGIHTRVVISVNEMHETDPNLLLKEGDFVRIFHPVGGGSSVKGNSHGKWL
jgi:sulfur carrier protein ThiS